MPEPTDPVPPADPVTERIRGLADDLAVLLTAAQAARVARDGDRAESVPTFYNWHNRPR